MTVSTAKVEHERTCFFQHSEDFTAKGLYPFYVLGFPDVTVSFLAAQCKRRGGHYEVYATVRELGKKLKRITYVCATVISSVKRSVFHQYSFKSCTQLPRICHNTVAAK